MQHQAFQCTLAARGELRIKRRRPASSVLFILSLTAVSLLTACSYITNFVVVNESDQPIEVRYRVREFPGAFYPPETPATMTAHQLRAGDKKWRELSQAQYAVNPEKRIVAVRVPPGEALLVERVVRLGMQVNDTEEAESFLIDELTITGARGEMKFQGEQARKVFAPESKKLYTLLYK